MTTKPATDPYPSSLPDPVCVVLFDIDGTLVTGAKTEPSAGVRAMDSASKATVGQKSAFSGVHYAGRTDFQIARMLLEDGGVSNPSRHQLETLITHYVDALAKWVETHPFRPLGSPRETIARLRRGGALVGLGTGNVRRGGFIKLKSAQIVDLFDPFEGGFGDDGEERAELLEKGALRLNPKRDLPVIIVGDTPFDVKGAHGMGGLCVGVPFGRNSRDDLNDAGADAVVDQIDTALCDVIFELAASHRR